MKALLSFAVALALVTTLRAETLSIVAAENFYGDVAAQIAGPSARVTSVLNNPNQDPHDFQVDAATARKIADADIVIYNGIDYDHWVERLLGVDGNKNRIAINVAELIGAKDGDNPHLWYNPKTIPALAEKLGEVLKNPDGAKVFIDSLKPLMEKIVELKAKTTGVKVTATEPVFEYMAEALGFDMLNADYQLAVMNDTDPSFEQTAGFENSLKDKTVKILFYNNQVADPSTTRMLEIAKANDVSVVGVTETQPPDQKTYLSWMLSQLDAIATCLK
ncbi:MAG: metal ABC transporter solute-binding protein, Zn/Mn family [Chthoniobacterales bacterium]